MPVAKYRKTLKEQIADRLAAYGPCLREGKELWMVLSGRKQVARVVTVEEGSRVLVENANGQFWVDPDSTIILTAAHEEGDEDEEPEAL